MTEKFVLDGLIQSANEAMTVGRFARALAFYESAIKYFITDILDQSDKSYYGHVLYCGLALAQAKLNMIEEAKKNILIGNSFKTRVCITNAVFRSFPVSAIQEIAADASDIADNAREHINSLGKPLNAKQFSMAFLEGFSSYAGKIYDIIGVDNNKIKILADTNILDSNPNDSNTNKTANNNNDTTKQSILNRNIMNNSNESNFSNYSNSSDSEIFNNNNDSDKKNNENINNDENTLSLNKSTLLIERGSSYYKIGEFSNALYDYQLAASFSPLSSHIWRRISLCAIKANLLETAVKSMARLQALGCSFHRAKAELQLCARDYPGAAHSLNMARKSFEPGAEAAIGRLRFVFGDVETALVSEIEAASNDDIDQLITQALLLLTGERMPSKISCMSPYAMCLRFVLEGIYKSLSYNIREVPVSLWMSVEARKTWYSMLTRDNAAKTFEYPEGFNFNFTQPDESVDLLVLKGFRFGEKLCSTSINAREKAACGLAYIQLIQSFKEADSYPYLNSIGDVGHWLRLVDPLAPIFYRFDMYLIYLKKNEHVTELSEYHQKVLEFMKFDLAAKTKEPIIKEKILCANSANQIHDILMANCYSTLPGNASAFITEQVDHTIAFGISVPYDELTISSFLSRTRPKWCKMMNMINQKSSIYDDSDIAIFFITALEWLYEFEKSIPMMYYSAVIGLVIFASLMTSYYGIEFTTPLIDPTILQMEAVLARNFENFFGKMRDNFICDFESSKSDIFDLPDVVDCFPTYHHRIQGLLQIGKIDGAFPKEEDFGTSCYSSSSENSDGGSITIPTTTTTSTSTPTSNGENEEDEEEDSSEKSTFSMDELINEERTLAKLSFK